MTRDRPTPEQAFLRYMQMGDGRSLVKLRDELAVTGWAPNLRTLKNWSADGH
jgi:hypothetical protein